MTKIEAIEMTIALWTYIAETGCSKREAIAKLELPEMINDCPCCEYANDRCSRCPVWTEASEERPYTNSCVDSNDGEYAHWFDARNIGDSWAAKEWALKIVHLAQQVLASERD